MSYFSGTSENDIFLVSSFGSYYDGMSGSDVVVFDGPVSEYFIEIVSGSELKVLRRGSSDSEYATLKNIEVIRFDDRDVEVNYEFNEVSFEIIDTHINSSRYMFDASGLYDGSFIIAWVGYDDSGYGIYAQSLNAEGELVGEEFLVNSTVAGSQEEPVVTALKDGGYLIVWTALLGSGDISGIYGQRYDGEKKPVSDEFLIGTFYDNNLGAQPSVAELEQGGVTVTWSSYAQDGISWGVFARSFDELGVAVTDSYPVNTYTRGYQINPDITGVVGGGYVITWEDDRDYSIYAQRFDSENQMVGAEFQVNEQVVLGASERAQGPSIAGLITGGFVIAWSVGGQDGSGAGVFAQIFDAEGKPQGDTFQVNTHSFLDQSNPSVSALSDGGFAITWQSSEQDGSGWGIYSQLFDENGGVLGDEFQVNYLTDNPQSSPSIVSSSDGGFLITWSGFFDGIYGSIYRKDIQIENSLAQGYIDIYGTPVEGNVLYASSEISDVDGVGDFKYQWFSDGVEIDGATNYFLILSQSEVGKSISLSVSFIDEIGNFEGPIFSDVTLPVENLNNSPDGELTIVGIASQGEVLIADVAITDEDGLGGFEYQWLADGNAIASATGTQYTLTQADVGQEIIVQVSYTDGYGTEESLISDPVTITNINDEPEGSVLLQGDPTQGEVLSVDTTTLNDADGLGVLSYQWLRDGNVITDAIETQYTLTQEDVGAAIRVQVSYTDGYGAVESLTSGPVAITNINDEPEGAVAIKGTPTQDKTLSVDTTTLTDADGLGMLSYQWLRNGASVSGATGTQYTLTQEDVGAAIRVQVSYTDGEGTPEDLTSDPVTIANLNDELQGDVTLEGTAELGAILSADTSSLTDADGLGSFSYQWLRDGSVIAGATEQSYALTSADIGAQIAVRVRYTDGFGTLEEITSSTTAPVTVPTIEGTVIDGYISGATIYIDTDGDGIADPEEKTGITTDANGRFSLEDDLYGSVIAIGGTNTDTGLANNLILSAPAGAGVITPITTLIDSYARHCGVNIYDAQEAVEILLGFSTEADLLNYDPFVVADSEATKIQKSAAALAALGDAAHADGGDFGMVVDVLINQLGSDASIDLADSATLTELFRGMLPQNLIEQAADTNAALQAANDLDAIAQAQQAAEWTPPGWSDTEALVYQMYIAYYQRPADPNGLKYWTEQINTYQNWQVVSGAFGAPENAENRALYGAKSRPEIIAEIYRSAFDREGAVSEISYWANSEHSLTNLAFAIVNGAQNHDAASIQSKMAFSARLVQLIDPAGSGDPAQYTQPFNFDGISMLRDVTAESQISTARVSETLSRALEGRLDSEVQVLLHDQFLEFSEPYTDSEGDEYTLTNTEIYLHEGLVADEIVILGDTGPLPQSF